MSVSCRRRPSGIGLAAVNSVAPPCQSMSMRSTTWCMTGELAQLAGTPAEVDKTPAYHCALQRTHFGRPSERVAAPGPGRSRYRICSLLKFANDTNITPTLSLPSNRPNQLGSFAGLVLGWG